MAPELLMGKQYDIKADVWSTGVCLFEMLFGCCPFEEKTIPLLIHRLKTSTLQIPLNINNVSLPTQNLIRSFLVYNPGHRTSFEKGFKDLNEYFDGENFREGGGPSPGPSALTRQRSDFSGNGRIVNYNQILQPRPVMKDTPHAPPLSFQKKDNFTKAFKKQTTPQPVYVPTNDQKLVPTTSFKKPEQSTQNKTHTISKPVEKQQIRKIQVINRKVNSSKPFAKPVQAHEVRQPNFIKVIQKEKEGQRKPGTANVLDYPKREDIHQIKDKYNTREQTQKVRAGGTLPRKTSMDPSRSNPSPKSDMLPPTLPTTPKMTENSRKVVHRNPPLNPQKPQRNLTQSPKPVQRRLSEIEQIDQNIKKTRNSRPKIIKARRNSEKSPLKFDAGAALDRLRGKPKTSPTHQGSSHQIIVEPPPVIKRSTPLFVESELLTLGMKALSTPVRDLIMLLTSPRKTDSSPVTNILRNRCQASLLIDLVKNILEYFRDQFREKQILQVQSFLVSQIEFMEQSEIDCTIFRNNSHILSLERSFPLESLCYFGSLLLLKRAKVQLIKVKDSLSPTSLHLLEDQLLNSQGRGY